MLSTGQTLYNRYEIIQPIGKGGIGAIYKCYDKNLNKYMAIKTLIINNRENQTVKKGIFSFIAQKTQNNNNQDSFLEENRVEVDILKDLKSDYIPTVYDFFIEDNQVYTVMEFIEGSDFGKLTKKNVFPTEQIIEWANQLCDAVEHLHTRKKPIIHSDIKPANLMLTSENNICLIDFNISKVFDKSGTTTTQGTKRYAPPEQLFNNIIDERSDIYSMGATLYNILTGNPPQHIDSNGILVQNLIFPEAVNNNLKRVIEKCMQKNPDSRYQTVAELRLDLNRHFVSDSTIKNTIGNTFSNICNRGLATIQGDYIYYSSGTALMKTSIKNNHSFKISSDIPKYINVIGDYIYYINSNDNKVYSIRTDGENKKLFLDLECGYLSVIDGNIYYINISDSYSIYRTDIQKIMNINIINQHCSSYCIYNERIFFTSKENNFSLSSVNLSGNDLQMHDNRPCGAISQYKNTLVYQVYDGSKYVLSILDTNKNPIIVFSDFGISNYNFIGNNLYLISNAEKGFRLYVKDLKQNNIINLVKDTICDSVNVVGNCIFYHNMIENSIEKIYL